MSEELLQRGLDKNPEKIGKWDFYSIGATTIKALKEYGILHNIDYGASERKKVDALIVSHKNVIAVIEYKKPSEFKTKAQKEKAIEQEIEVAQKLKAKVFIATDTKESVWVNTLTGNKIKDENGNEIKILFDHKDEKVAELIKKICDSINVKNDSIKPKQLINPTDLAKKIWQIVWSISGATPENCLYTFVELFIFKYLSDLRVLRGRRNFYSLLKDIDKNKYEELLEDYARTIRPNIKKELFPQGSDGTTIINGTVFVNNDDEAIEGRSTAFKKILKEFKAYGKLDNIHPDFKSQIFESFLKESISKKNWGQFFTPLKVVRSIIEMAKDEIKEGVKICDPACGVGKFLLEAIKPKIKEFYKIEKIIEKKEKKTVIQKSVELYGYDIGFDKDEQKTIILAKANMLIYFSDLIKENPELTKNFSNLFNESFTLKTNSILGTLSEPIENEYDLILTNPPYGLSGSSNIKEEIIRKGLANDYKTNAMGKEGLFMEWIVRALKPTKKAFVVIPDGILNRQNDKNLRQFILDECYIDGLISLPEKTFFTTPKKTYILAITKKTNKQDIQKEPVFTYLVSEIGESRDIYRFDIEQNDLENAVVLFNQFKGAKNHFKTDELRCKIQPVEKFDSNLHWSVDRWWTKEEQIKLGILEENKTIPFEEFPSLLEDVANNILAFKEEIETIDIGIKTANNSNSKTVKIEDIFDFQRGRVISKEYIQKNEGDYPVYSSNTLEAGLFGKINSYDFDCKGITWTTDGIYAGTTFYKEGKFSITNVCGLMTLKKKYELRIYLPYIQKILNFKKIATGTDNKKVMTNVILKSGIKILIPIDKNGEFDLQVQKEIAEKYKQVENIKTSIVTELDKIDKMEVSFL